MTAVTGRYVLGTARLAAGELATTTSGRQTAPFPRLDLSTDRRASATTLRVRTWLLAEARAEFAHRGRPATGLDTMDVRNWAPADGDICELALFDPEFWN